MGALNDKIITFVDSVADQLQRPKMMVGFADLENTPLMPDDGLPRAIAIAAPMRPESIKDVSDGPTAAYYKETVELQAILDDLSRDLAHSINEVGFQARALIDDDVSELADCATMVGGFKASGKSMKKIATRAAIGWVGKSCLLITKHYGPAVLLGAVYTDAPLDCSKETFLSRCERCTECIYACPVAAISGADWRPGENYDSMVDKDVCAERCRRSSKEALGVEADVCGICVLACPYTKAYLRRTESLNNE